MVPDLDSRSLSRAVCRPLRVPLSYNPPTNLGSLTFDGQFAIAESQGPPIGVQPGLESFILERCGTHLHKTIEPLLVAPAPIGRSNTHALMTTQGSQQLTGMLLPSLRAFTINLSKQMAGGYFALTERHVVYWVAYDGRVWMAASPGLPPVKR